jgi:hypothetical protein
MVLEKAIACPYKEGYIKSPWLYVKLLPSNTTILITEATSAKGRSPLLITSVSRITGVLQR